MRLFILGFLGLPLLPLVARAAITSTVNDTHAVSATSDILVENVNGSVSIETWDKDEVRLEAVKKAKNQTDIDALEVAIDASDDRYAVRTIYRDKDGSWLKKFTNTGEVAYTLTVPRRATLRKIETVNGRITITNAEGRISAKTVNGRIDARGLQHEVDLNVVNGAIRVEFDRVSDKQDISLEVANGGIELLLPPEVGAEISATTVNGSISNAFGLNPKANRWVGRELEGRTGDGSARIRLRTINGSIDIRKR